LAERDDKVGSLEARLATITSEVEAIELARKSLAEQLDKVQSEKAELAGKLRNSDEKNKGLVFFPINFVLVFSFYLLVYFLSSHFAIGN
jgi:hypothetical protein